MELHLPPLHTLLSTVGGQLGGELGMIFQQAGAQMQAVTGRPPQTALRIALDEQPGALDREEEALLLQLAGSLGRYDLDGQLRAMDLCRQRLEDMTCRAEQTLRQRARASMTASVCAGLALIVMLL